MNNETKKTRKRESKPKFTEEQRLNNLEKWREDVGEELRNLGNLKLSLSEFVFQTVIIIISIFAVIITIILGFASRWNFDDTTKSNLLLGLLVVLTIILSIWLYLWFILNFRKKKW